MAATIKELVESREGSTVGYGVGNQDTTRTFKLTFSTLAEATSTDPYPVMMGTSSPVVAGSVPVGSSHPWATVTALAQKYKALRWRPGLPGWIMQVMYEPLSALLDQGWTWTVQGQVETKRIIKTVKRLLPGGGYTTPKLIGAVRYRSWTQSTVGINDPTPNTYYVNNKFGNPWALMPEGTIYPAGVFGEESYRNYEGADVPTGGGSLLTFKKNTTSLNPLIIGLLENLRKTCNQGSFSAFSNVPGTIFFYDFEVGLQDGFVTGSPIPQNGQPVILTMRFLYNSEGHTPIYKSHFAKIDDGEEGPVYKIGPNGREYIEEDFDVIPLTDLNSVFGLVGP